MAGGGETDPNALVGGLMIQIYAPFTHPAYSFFHQVLVQDKKQRDSTLALPVSVLGSTRRLYSLTNVGARQSRKILSLGTPNKVTLRIHSGRLTWNLWKTACTLLYNPLVFRSSVNLPGCTADLPMFCQGGWIYVDISPFWTLVPHSSLGIGHFTSLKNRRSAGILRRIPMEQGNFQQGGLGGPTRIDEPTEAEGPELAYPSSVPQ